MLRLQRKGSGLRCLFEGLGNGLGLGLRGSGFSGVWHEAKSKTMKHCSVIMFGIVSDFCWSTKRAIAETMPSVEWGVMYIHVCVYYIYIYIYTHTYIHTYI